MIFLLLLLFPFSVFGQSNEENTTLPEVKIRAFLKPDGGIYVGQLVRLWVEIYSLSGFSKAPQYPELQLKGAIVLLPDQFGVNTTTKIAGETWVGQRQRYAIIPQREGTFIVPPITIVVSLKNGSEATNPITIQTQPIKLSASLPPGMANFEQVLTANNVSLVEVYDRETSGLQVGDAITRTITMRGENTFALAIPPVSFDQIGGTRVYLAKPILNDQTHRGKYSGTRIDSATYVLEQVGDITLPEIKVAWWDPDLQSMEEAVLPAIDFHVAENPDYQSSSNIPAGARDWKEIAKENVASIIDWLWNNKIWLSIAVIGLYLIRTAWRLYGAIIIGKWQAWRQRRSMSETRFFDEFRQACNTNNERTITVSFWRWVDSLSPDAITAPTLSAVGLKEHGRWASRYFEQLERSRYGSESIQYVDGRKIYQAMKIHRQETHAKRSSMLAPAPLQLNPRGH